MLKSSQLVLSTMFALGCAVAVHAQTSTSAQTNRTIPGEITVTGCVERADQMASSSTAAATVDSLTFMLIHAQNGTADQAQPTGTSGTKEGANGKMYRLDAQMPTLNPHVGHKVEVTGTLEAPTAPASDSVEPQSPTNAPRLKVDHVKLISETCAR